MDEGTAAAKWAFLRADATTADRLIGEPEKVAAEHDIFGCRYVGLGWYNFTEKGQRTTADFFETYLPVAEALQSHGKYFMYHNHDMDAGQLFNPPCGVAAARLNPKGVRREAHFVRRNTVGKTVENQPAVLPTELHVVIVIHEVLAVRLQRLGDRQVGLEEIGTWWIEKLSGRVPCIHLKDFAYGRKMAVVGEGNLNFDRIFAAAADAGTEYMLVEQDDCNGKTR